MHIAIKITLWILLAFLVLLTGTFLYLQNADLSRYETQIETALSNAIGHKIDFDGLFELEFGSLTKVTAEDVVITNAKWTADPQLLTVGHFSVTVDTWSLLYSPIIIHELDLRDARINVEEDATGAVNWDSDKVSEETSESEEFDANFIAFKDVRVENFQLVFDTPDRSEPLVFSLTGLEVRPDEADVLDLSLRGAINEYSLAADGRIGPWQNLVDGRDLTVDLDLALGQVRLDLEGSVADLTALEGVELSASLQGPAIERIAGVFGLPEFATGEFQLDGEIRKQNELNVVRLTGNLGEIDVSAGGSVDKFLMTRKMALEFSLSGPDTLHLAEVFGVDGAPNVPFDVSGNLSQNESRIDFRAARVQLGENQVNLDGWLDFGKRIPDGDVTISASGPNFAAFESFAGLQGIPAEAFNISGHMEKSGRRVRFDDVIANVGPNKISANGAIDPDGGERTEVFVSVEGPDISIIETISGLADVPRRPFSASAYLRPDSIGINLDEAKLVVGDNQLEIDGIIGTLNGANGTRISLHGFGPDLLNISLLTGVPYMPQGEYDYVADITIDDEVLNVDKFDLTVVGATAAVSGQVNIGADAGEFELQIAANSDDVSQLELFASLKELDGEALRISGKVGSAAGVFTLTAVTADIGNIGFAVNGQLKPGDASANLTFSANAPDTELLDRFLVDQPIPVGPVLMNGQIQKTPEAIRFTDTSARIGEFFLNIDGMLSMSPMSNSSDLSFKFSGPDIYSLGEIVGLKTLPNKPFSFAGHVDGIPSGFAIEDIDANIGENDIAGRFTADLRGKPKVSGSLSASYLDIASQIAEEDLNTTESDPGPYVIPEEPLPLDFLNTFDANIDLRAEHLLLTNLDVHGFHIGVEVEDGALRVDPISLGQSDGKLSGRLSFVPEADKYQFDTLINIENIHIGVVDPSGGVQSALPALNGTIELGGHGVSPHEIMATSNGRISLSQGPGQTNSVAISRLFGDLVSEILQAINPLHKADTYTSLECAFYDIGIENGVATIEEIIIQTDKVTMAAEGSIAFSNESLKMSVNTKSRKGFGISVGGIANSFLNIRGTLKKPALGIDAAGSLTTGGAAVATAGLSLVAKGLWDRVQAEKNICDRPVDNPR